MRVMCSTTSSTGPQSARIPDAHRRNRPGFDDPGRDLEALVGDRGVPDTGRRPDREPERLGEHGDRTDESHRPTCDGSLSIGSGSSGG